MKQIQKKMATLLGLFLMFTASMPFLSDISNNFGNTINDDITEGDENGPINDLNESPKSSIIDSLTQTGAKVGLIGYTDGVKAGTISNAQWAEASGLYDTHNFAYTVPEPVSSGGTINPTWNYQQTTTSVTGINEENDFYWDKEFVDDWSESADIYDSGTGVNVITAEQMTQSTGGRDFLGQKVGYMQFNSNDKDNNYNPISDNWNGNTFTGTTVSRSHSSHTRYHGSTSWTTCGGTYQTDGSCQGDYQCAQSATSTPNTVGLAAYTHLQTGYYVRRSDGESHATDDWSYAGVYFSDYINPTAYAWADLDYVRDGTVPYDVDFTATFRTLAAPTHTQVSSISVTQWTTLTITLYNEGETRSQQLYSNTFSQGSYPSGFTQAISASDIEGFFTENCNYRIKVWIENYLKLDRAWFDTYNPNSGGTTCNYAAMGNSAAAQLAWNVRLDSINFHILEEDPYPANSHCYLESDITFNARHVKSSPNPVFDFDYSIQSELQNSGTSFSDIKMRATLNFDYGGSGDSAYKEWDISSGASGNAQWFLTSTEITKLNLSQTITVQLGVFIASGGVFELAYGSGGGWSRIMFANVGFLIGSIPRPSDVALRLEWQDGSTWQGGKLLTTGEGHGYGSMIHTSSEDDFFNDFTSLSFYFSSSSQKLAFSYEQEVVATFEDFTRTSTIRAQSGSDTVSYDVTFDWYVPHGVGLKPGRDFTDAFIFNITFPGWLLNSEMYWDLAQVYLNTGFNQESISASESSSYNPETQIYVMQDVGATYGSYANTQIGHANNDLFDEYFSSSFSQDWTFNFTAPNIINDVIMDDNKDFSSPTTLMFSSNISNVRLNYEGSVSTGDAGVRWYSIADVGQESTEIVLSGAATYTDFIDGNGWDTGVADVGDYYVVGNYSDDHTNMDIPTGINGMEGVNRLGFWHDTFSVVKDTYMDWLSIDPDLYDTKTHGLNGDLINISIMWREKGGAENGVTEGDVKISISTWVVGAGDIKEPAIPAEWHEKDMLDMGNGLYTMFVDPTFYGHLGNITWGYHNFTISASKFGYLSKSTSGNFSIIVDTALTIIDPDQGSKEPVSQHPHYKQGIMGGNESGTPADYMTVFSAYFYENLSTPSYFTNNPGNPYRGNVEVTYECLNYTRGSLNWWNWTWQHDKFSSDNSGNPINGSFIASGSEWQGTIYFPQKGTVYFQNITQYQSGIFLEYNVTARVITNSTYPPPGLTPYDYQPNIVVNQSCEDGYAVGAGGPDTAREETILLRLIDPEEGNFTRIVLFNDQQEDGTPYEYGTYDNKSADTQYPYENPVYRLEQYYLNQSVGPHGTYDNTFRLRILFNCSHQVKEQKHYIVHPPCGPLNDTDVSVRLFGWIEGQSIPLTADPSYLWIARVKENGTEIMRDYYGVTYVTGWLNFSDYYGGSGNHDPPSSYALTIRASKEGYISSQIGISLTIRDQLTELNYSNEVIDSAAESKPITDKTPIGNATKYTLTFTDITNRFVPGESDAPITGAAITCTGDNLLNNPFLNNQTAVGEDYVSTWRWVDENNGNYSVYLDYTDFDSYLDNPRNINFEITAHNYTTRTFTIVLNITHRTVQIDLMAQSNISYFTERDDYDSKRFITFKYRVLDLDNNSELVDFSTGDVYVTFRFKYWNATLSVRNFNFTLVNPGDPSNEYNITLDIKDINVGVYNFNLTVDQLLSSTYIYYMASHDSTFRIDPAPIQISTIDTKETVEYLASNVARDFQLINSQPYFEVMLIDNYFSTQDGYVTFTGMFITTNYSNPNYDNFTLHASKVHEDLRVDDNEGNIKVYIDAQRMTSNDAIYYLNITFIKKNYLSTNMTVSFIITNATTRFINILFDTKDPEITDGDRSSFPESSSNYEADLTLPWNRSVGIKFTYETVIFSTKISTDTLPEVTTMGYAIKDFYSNVSWPENASIFEFSQLGAGIHYLKFKLNISVVGTIKVWFNISIWTDNFDPMYFLINLTIRDRFTSNETKVITPSVYWTEKATFVTYYQDEDYKGIGGKEKRSVLEALVNGSATGGVLNLSGNEAKWAIKFIEADAVAQLDDRYEIEIWTNNLSTGQNYTILFEFSKAHYQTLTLEFYFEIKPVSIRINTTVKPDNAAIAEQFRPDEVTVIFIYVSVYVQLYNASGEVEVNVDYSLPNINVSFIVRDVDKNIVYKGRCYWSATEQAFVGNFSTTKADGDYLIGVFDLEITVETNDNRITGSSQKIKILGIGSIVGGVPDWFWILLTLVVGAAVGMAGYTVKKALYLRIPFVLRKIDETTKKIEKDKYPPVGVMTGRDEFIINSVINYLELCGIEWEREDKFEVKKVGEAAAKEKLPPLKLDDIEQALNDVGGLSKEEIVLFTDELKRLDRTAQDEFLASLRGDVGKSPKE